MKFITAEQFTKADVKVQNAILEWWKPSTGDLYCNLYNNQQRNVFSVDKSQLSFKSFSDDIKSYGVPLLTVGQLIEFIEDKLGGKIDIGYYYSDNNGYKGYTISVWLDEPYVCIKEFEDLGVDLLQVLWQVVNQIIKEGGLFSFPRRKMS